MPQSTHDRAAELHSLAEHAHAAAVASHNKVDKLTSHERSKVADEHSTTKHKHVDEVAPEITKQDKA